MKNLRKLTGASHRDFDRRTDDGLTRLKSGEKYQSCNCLLTDFNSVIIHTWRCPVELNSLRPKKRFSFDLFEMKKTRTTWRAAKETHKNDMKISLIEKAWNNERVTTRGGWAEREDGKLGEIRVADGGGRRCGDSVRDREETEHFSPQRKKVGLWSVAVHNLIITKCLTTFFSLWLRLLSLPSFYTPFSAPFSSHFLFRSFFFDLHFIVRLLVRKEWADLMI